MTNDELLRSRPADPSKISFARDCFETVGTREEYVVVQSALHSGPARFADKTEAERFARRSGRTVSVRVVQVQRRVKWF